MSNALITGCATGFGHLLTQRLLAAGWTVYATDVEPEGLVASLGGPHPRLHVHGLDVRSPEDIATVLAALGDRPLDLLVNNAGYAVFGNMEDVPVDAIRDMFEVNVFGLGAVTRAFLPAVRAAKGTVVNLSSVAGLMVFPESGWYAATKHAVEAMSSALYQEASVLGVRVRVIEPGSFDTQFGARADAASPPRPTHGPYAEQHAAWDAAKTAALEPPQAPSLVVDAILASLNAPEAYLRVPVGLDCARILAHYPAAVPDAWRAAKR